MPDASLRGQRILVVEDEYMLADDLRQALEEEGCLVLGPVGHLDDALALVEQEAAIDAAVLDINLGGEKSFPVTDALLARDVPVLFATGYGEKDVPARYERIGRVYKPVEPRAIVKALARRLFDA